MTAPTPTSLLPMSLIGWNFDEATNVVTMAFTKGDPTECYEGANNMAKTFVVRLQGIEAPIECLPNENPAVAVQRAIEEGFSDLPVLG